MTHYQTLGVSQNASPEDIKKAFRVLAGKHHPDKGGDQEKFKELILAYDTLKEPAARSQYDSELSFGNRRGQYGGPFNNSGRPRAGPGGVHFGFNPMDDGMGAGGFNDGSFPEDIANLFRQMHDGGQPNMHTTQRDKRNRDVRITMRTSLKELLNVQSKTISVQTPGGAGESLYVTIPVTARNGTKIRYPGLGDNMFKSLPRGDLYIEVEVDEHPSFSYNENNLYTRVQIDPFDAITGGETPISGLDGKEFMLKIPAGTQPQTKMRIAGEGLYTNNNLTSRGDLFLTIDIVVPKLSQDQIDSVKKLKISLNN